MGTFHLWMQLVLPMNYVYRWPLLLVATMHVQNLLGRDGQGKDQPIQNRPKPDSQGCPGNTFAHLQKSGGKNTGPRRGDFQSAAWLLTQGMKARTNVTEKKDPKQG